MTGDGRLHVVVTGATGTVGRGLLAHLRAERRVRSVVALGSRPHAALRNGGKVRYRQADVRDGDALRDAFAGADVVVHLAYVLPGVRQSEAELRAVNVDGSRNAFEAAREAGARRFVYTSSAAVYGTGDDQPQPIREDAPLRPDDRHFYSRHKVEVERHLHEQAQAGAGEIVVLRPCGVVGPHALGAAVHGAPGWLDPVGQLLKLLYGAGVRPWLPGPPVPLQFVHEADVGAAIARAITLPVAAGTYNLAGDGVLDGAEVIRTLGSRPLPAPRPLVAAAVHAASALPKPLPAGGWIDLLRRPLLLDTSAAKEQLGWRPRFTSRDALVSLRAALSA